MAGGFAVNVRVKPAPGAVAMSPLRTVVAVVIAACVADCAGERKQIANYAQNKMVGLTKDAVLACMGTPASKATEGATEVWSYPSGNCTVNVTMMMAIPSVCIPREQKVTTEQVRDVVVKDLAAHPETGHQTAAGHALLRLQAAFPCK